MKVSTCFSILSVVLLAASCFAFQPKSFVSTSSIASRSTTELWQSPDDAPPLARNPPRKIALMVEPSPFTHVSGYSNRFKEMLKYLKKAGDDVEVLTVENNVPKSELPKEFLGYKVDHTLGFTWPLYKHISLTLDLPEMKGSTLLERHQPDLIHVTSP